MQFSDLFSNGFSLIETKNHLKRNSIKEGEVSIWYSISKKSENAGITFGIKEYLGKYKTCDILCANDGQKRVIIRFYTDKNGRTGSLTSTRGSHGSEHETYYTHGVPMVKEVMKCLGINYENEPKTRNLLNFTKIQDDIYLLTPKNS